MRNSVSLTRRKQTFNVPTKEVVVFDSRCSLPILTCCRTGAFLAVWASSHAIHAVCPGDDGHRDPGGTLAFQHLGGLVARRSGGQDIINKQDAGAIDKGWPSDMKGPAHVLEPLGHGNAPLERRITEPYQDATPHRNAKRSSQAASQEVGAIFASPQPTGPEHRDGHHHVRRDRGEFRLTPRGQQTPHGHRKRIVKRPFHPQNHIAEHGVIAAQRNHRVETERHFLAGDAPLCPSVGVQKPAATAAATVPDHRTKLLLTLEAKGKFAATGRKFTATTKATRRKQQVAAGAEPTIHSCLHTAKPFHHVDMMAEPRGLYNGWKGLGSLVFGLWSSPRNQRPKTKDPRPFL